MQSAREVAIDTEGVRRYLLGVRRVAVAIHGLDDLMSEVQLELLERHARQPDKRARKSMHLQYASAEAWRRLGRVTGSGRECAFGEGAELRLADAPPPDLAQRLADEAEEDEAEALYREWQTDGSGRAGQADRDRETRIALNSLPTVEDIRLARQRKPKRRG